MSSVKDEEVDETEIEDMEDDDELVDVTELFEVVNENTEHIATLLRRTESMDKALFGSVRGMVITLRAIERIIDPQSSPQEKAQALQSVREILSLMEKTL